MKSSVFQIGGGRNYCDVFREKVVNDFNYEGDVHKLKVFCFLGVADISTESGSEGYRYVKLGREDIELLIQDNEEDLTRTGKEISQSFTDMTEGYHAFHWVNKR